MQAICTYHVEVRGELDEVTFNAASPLQVTVVRTDPEATLFAVCADQSGLIGLIRHLHQRGFELLSVYGER